MTKIFQTSHFKGDLKRVTKRGKKIEKLKEVVLIISKGEQLEDRYRGHGLSGNWIGSILNFSPVGSKKR